jgi:hypothetical protein
MPLFWLVHEINGERRVIIDLPLKMSSTRS